jgi:hypothetical protein
MKARIHRRPAHSVNHTIGWVIGQLSTLRKATFKFALAKGISIKRALGSSSPARISSRNCAVTVAMRDAIAPLSAGTTRTAVNHRYTTAMAHDADREAACEH